MHCFLCVVKRILTALVVIQFANETFPILRGLVITILRCLVITILRCLVITILRCLFVVTILRRPVTMFRFLVSDKNSDALQERTNSGETAKRI
jgi:hypothetical protein